jgi:SAM-dependent methyltransferase
MNNESEVKYIHTEAVHNLMSPKIIVPVLFQWFQPKSVVDVGCGIGTFLKVFKDLGVKEILGIDGKWVDRAKLYISDNEFMVADLEKPIVLDRTFDLVLSLEVAEHLSSESSDNFVNSLVSLGKIIVFSAAIPNQGGQNHLNEQDYSYWQKKFLKKGYGFVDICRQRFWNEKEIEWWYKQNMFVVVHESIDISNLVIENTSKDLLTQVHPDLYKFQLTVKDNILKDLNDFKNGRASFWVYLNIIKRKIKKKIFKK